MDRFVVGHPAIPREDHRGMRFTALWVGWRSGAAHGLLVHALLAADELILKPRDYVGIDYAIQQRLPDGLAVVTMLAAASFTLRSVVALRVTSWRKRTFGLAVVLGGPLIAILYWAGSNVDSVFGVPGDHRHYTGPACTTAAAGA